MNMIGDEILVAYADGELSGSRRDEVERALAADPELRARLEAQQRLRARIAGHYATVAQEPVPDRIAALIRDAAAQDRVVPLAEFRRRRSAPAWQTLTALAATLVLGLFAGAMLPRGSGADGPVAVAEGSLVARGALAEALERQLASDQRGDGTTRIGISFAATDGRLCRTFDSEALSGLACRGQAGWQLLTTAAPARPGAGEYRQAGSANTLILQAAQEMMAGEPLDAAGERSARERGWRTGRD